MTSLSEKVRVLRLIEYSGSREAVERQLAKSMKNGTHEHLNCARNYRNDLSLMGDCVTIKIATVGDFPEILKRAEMEEAA